MLFISYFVHFSFRKDQVYDSHFTGWSTVYVFAQLPVTNFMAERPLKNSPCSHQTFISLDIQFLWAYKFLSLYKNGYTCFVHQSEFGLISNNDEITEFQWIFLYLVYRGYFNEKVHTHMQFPKNIGMPYLWQNFTLIKKQFQSKKREWKCMFILFSKDWTPL
jgi:hypothetical protein